MENLLQLLFVTLLLKQATSTQQHIARIAAPHCRQNIPTEQPHKCCIIPDLFEEETNQGCSELDRKRRISLRGSPECAERTCLLRNNDLLFDNDEIDNESFKQYLDEWVSKRREFQPAVNAVKSQCLGAKPLFGPNGMCPADKLLFCVDTNFYSQCPNWLKTRECRALRTYMESCMPYFR